MPQPKNNLHPHSTAQNRFYDPIGIYEDELDPMSGMPIGQPRNVREEAIRQAQTRLHDHLYESNMIDEMNPYTDSSIIITEEDFEDEAMAEKFSQNLNNRQQLDRNNAFLQAYTGLNIAMIAVPMVAGLDKFTLFFTDWSQYLAPVFPKILGITKMGFMYGVGTFEIAMGIGAAFKPRVFGYLLCAWFSAIMVNLIVVGGFYDVALHDFGLALAAFALAKLSEGREDNLLSITDSEDERSEGFTGIQSPVLH